MRVGRHSILLLAVTLTLAVRLGAQESPEEEKPPVPPAGQPLVSADQNKTAVPAVDQNKTAPAVTPGTNPDQPPAPEPPELPVIPPAPKEKMPEPINGVDFGSFIKANPFRLTRPEDKPMVKETGPLPPPRSSVRVTGIIVFRGKEKVFLEVKRTGEKDPSHYTLEEGELVDRIKVVDIDPVKGVVKLENDGQPSVVFFDEEPNKTSTTEAFPTRGGSSFGTGGSPGGSSRFSAPGSGAPKTDRTRPGGSGGDSGTLKGVPTRRRTDSSNDPSNPGQPLPQLAMARPQWLEFDKAVQTQLVVANQIPTQREFPRGVFSREIPTDLPVKRK